MLKKAIHEKAFATDGWLSFDPVDAGLIEAVYKKSLREGEERLMLAVLENAVEYFQKYVLARNPGGKQRFQVAQEWFLERFLSLGFISESGGEEGESNAYYCSHQLSTFAFNYLDRFCLGNSRMSIIGRGKERRRGALLLRKYLRDPRAASRPKVEFCRGPSCW